MLALKVISVKIKTTSYLPSPFPRVQIGKDEQMNGKLSRVWQTASGLDAVVLRFTQVKMKGAVGF